MARGKRQKQANAEARDAVRPQVRRNRASPSRLVKLYKYHSEAQRKMISKVRFGGLLKIACSAIPQEYAHWLLVECFDAETSNLVFPGRGRIAVTPESTFDILELPNSGDKVKYDLDAINFFHEKYDCAEGTTLKIDSIVELVKKNKLANDDFLRSWLMLAVSTFLCPPTSLCISPRCYPPLVQLSSVKKLNWCQFVVDQLKDAAKKIGNKNSVRGCLLLLVVLYVDSLEIPGLQIPNTKPRIAVWSNKLLNKVIKLDINLDGSFGKLKVKQSQHSTAETSFFTMNDIHRFVSSKAPRGISEQKRRKICESVNKVLSGVTQLLGTFVQEIVEAEESSAPSSSGPCFRRSTRTRTATSHQALSSEDDHDEDADYEEGDEEEYTGTSAEEDLNSEDFSYQDEDSEADHGENAYSDRAPEPMQQPSAIKSDIHDQQPSKSAPREATPPTQDDDSDFVPLSKRLRQLQSSARQDGKATTAAATGSTEELHTGEGTAVPDFEMEPIPISVVLPHEAQQGAVHWKSIKPRLRLPNQQTRPMEEGNNNTECSEQVPEPNTRQKMSFTPPDINIMQFIKETNSLVKQTDPVGKNSKSDAKVDGPADLWWDLANLSEEQFRQLEELEEEAIRKNNIKKGKMSEASTSKQNVEGACSSIKNDQRSSSSKLRDEAKNENAEPKPTPEALEAPSTVVGDASITPAYEPPPMRNLRKSTVLQSPYAEPEPKISLKCNKAVCKVYDAVCSCTKRSTNRSEYIINYPTNFVELGHLADSVRPGGKLKNTVAEIGICFINGSKKRAMLKWVLPLAVSTCLQEKQIEMSVVTQAFNRSKHHLDHRHLEMIPVIQPLVKVDPDSGHYFLIVLNLRNKRIEVFDSMRTLADKSLLDCCMTIINSVKFLWRVHYPNSRHNIDDYELIEIDIAKQQNNHDCGFYMLLHAQYWDGRSVLKVDDMYLPNVRKVLTHKWITTDENDVEWTRILKLD